jgi:tetratricopeptide (TPR) repeat protein
MAGTSGVIVLLLGTLSSALQGQADGAVLQQAESAFVQGLQLRSRPGAARKSFQEAAQLYGALVQRGRRNAALLRNSGNASLLAGDLPQAILAYRAGLQLSPGDQALKRSLNFARAQVAYPDASAIGRPPSEQRPPWLPHIASIWQLLMAFITYATAWFLLTRWWLLRRGRLLFAALVSAGLTACLIVSLTIQYQQNRQNLLHPVVVISDDGVLLRSGNGLAYPPRYETPLNRGVEARLLYERGQWLQIELSGGEAGWVPAEYTRRLQE